MITSKDLAEFIEYCNDFYNIETGLYKVATKNDIVKAIGQFITKTNGKDIYFDSLDREKVREILEPSYSII